MMVTPHLCSTRLRSGSVVARITGYLYPDPYPNPNPNPNSSATLVAAVAARASSEPTSELFLLR